MNKKLISYILWSRDKIIFFKVLARILAFLLEKSYADCK